MKHSLLALVVLALTSIAHADIAEDLNAECSTNQEILKHKGRSGSCRVVIAPKPVDTRGACRATSGDITCLAVFVSNTQGSAMKLTCYTDPKEPILDHTFKVKSSGLSAAFIIKKADGTDFVINSEKTFLNFSTDNVIVDVVEDAKAGTKSGQIVIMTEQGPAVFGNAFCQNI